VQLGQIKGVDWARLSNIGQTYGAASAFLTALALLGLAGSILFQARAIQVSREQASGGLQQHLAEMSMTDPVYQRCWAVDTASYPTPDGWRQQVYLNLIFSYWERDFVIGGISEYTVRGLLADIFRGEAARRFWLDTGEVRMAYSRDRVRRRFFHIIDEEYGKAAKLGPPVVAADVLKQVARPRESKHRYPITAAALLLGAACGAVLGRNLGRSSRRS
jgi:hypothetical protein